jgi:uncharacterized lipoprotein YmbA
MRYYTLTPVAPASAPTAASMTVRLGRVSIPRETDRSELVQRIDATQINLHEQDRWAAPFEDLVRRTLKDDLDARLPDSGNPGASSRVLAVEIEEFIADASCNVVLRATWSLTEGNAPAPQKSERIDAPASGACSTSALPPTMSRALAELTDRIATAAGR